MALHPKFPSSPHEILDPSVRWFPAEEALREQGYDKLLPPLVAKLREEVQKWRISGYEGATETSKALLNWWFDTDHYIENSGGESMQFQYYFAQREAVETIIYLCDVAGVKDKYDLMRYDSSGAIAAGMFTESWKRYVVKMATGSGKTKVLSLILAWSYFHKTYEENSTLARNFLVIAPNIIVLDRIRADFDGLKIFYDDPILPDNGYEGRNWRDDFQMTLHIQDNIGTVHKTGNIFLTNIHRVYESRDTDPTFEDDDTTAYFLGTRPTGKTNESKVDVSDIVRDIDELVVLNDEAHHIHDPKLAWFKSIEDIHNRLLMKDGALALQVDVTATPKHNNGSIFVQTVSDYPLVEAIHQHVVKKPVLPDNESRGKMREQKSAKYVEQYKDYLHLGYKEWLKAYNEHIKCDKKAVLFVMTDETKSCDEVAAYLEETYPELKDAILTIHTNTSGEISESTERKNEEELNALREEANTIDTMDSKYKAIVSVLMLKEGWDVKNVTTIVGLRAYSAKSNILPEQTLGRGLRRMYRDAVVPEKVSVIGTDAFMEFVESIKIEGVELEYAPMNEQSGANTPIVIEVDTENKKKDIALLDIQIPELTPRIYREYKNLNELDVSKSAHKKVPIQEFTDEEKRIIRFADITTGEITHETELEGIESIDYQNVVGWFTREIMHRLRLVSGYDVLYPKVMEFTKQYLFEKAVDLSDTNILRNLADIEASRTVIETFEELINALTVIDRGHAEIKEFSKVSTTRPYMVQMQESIIPQKSVFNKMVGDSHFELEFAAFLDRCSDVVSFIKNDQHIHFKIDYKNASGTIANYYPDFVVKLSDNELHVVETKGREDLDDPIKIERLKQWCHDVNSALGHEQYKMLYVTQDKWDKERPNSFEALVQSFR